MEVDMIKAEIRAGAACVGRFYTDKQMAKIAEDSKMLDFLQKKKVDLHPPNEYCRLPKDWCLWERNPHGHWRMLGHAKTLRSSIRKAMKEK